MKRFLAVIVTLVILSLCTTCDAAYFVSPVAFENVNSITIYATAQIDGLSTTEDKVAEIALSSLYSGLRARLPRLTVKRMADAPDPFSHTDGLLSISVLLFESRDAQGRTVGFVGSVSSEFLRLGYIYNTQSAYYPCVVAADSVVVTGPEHAVSVSVRDAIGDIVYRFANDFYKARPDL